MTDQNPLLENTGRGFTISYRGKHLYSSEDPIENVLKRVKSFSCKPKTLIFIPSPLLFYGIDILLTKIPDSCAILCVEADEKLMSLSLEYSDRSNLRNERIIYIRTKSADKLSAVLKTMDLWNFRRVCMVTLSGGYMINRSIYLQLHQRVESDIREYWRNRMTLIHMSRLWFKNLLTNLRLLPDNDTLSSIKTEYPILICGAGESLETSITFIRDIRERIFLIAVDTALTALKSSGIQPDLILIVEAQYANLMDFIYHKNCNIPILADITAYPGSLRLFTGKKYFFMSNFADSTLFNRMEKHRCLPDRIPPLGSVGVIAVLTAKKITNGPIFFTGLDFSYRPGKPHANGCPSHLKTLSISSRFNPPGFFKASIERSVIRTLDKYRNPCITDNVLDSYNSLLKQITADQPNFFDIGNSGLDTGAKVVSDKTDVLRIVDTWENDSRKGDKNTPIKAASDAIQSFLIGEKILLEELINTGRSFLNGDMESTEALSDLLRKTDYVYLHFPDVPPVPFTDTGFIKRVLVFAGKYLKVIINILKHWEIPQ